MIWLVGNKGMLGTEVAATLEARGLEYVGTDREVDITDPAALRAFAGISARNGKKIGLIVNCAAYTAVDKAEDDRELCARLNALGPGNIASCAAEIGAALLHVSTDYVFDGKGSRPYRENDETRPIGVYGLTKREGELATLANNPRTWIVRTAWLYGAHGNNFVFTMLRLMKERETLSVVNDQRGSPTWARDLASVVADFALPPAGTPSYPYGVYHFTNEGETTWFEFAREILRLGREMNLLDPSKPFELRPVSSDEYPAKVKRPLYSVLDKSKIKEALGRDIPHWKDSLEEFLSSTQKEHA